MSEVKTDSSEWKISKVFSWQTPDAGKAEWDEFWTVFIQSLGEYSYVLDPTQVAMATPTPVAAISANANAAVRNRWEDKTAEYKRSMLKV